MPGYPPRSSEALLRDTAARYVTRAPGDLHEGSALLHFFASLAETLAGTEYRLGTIRDSFFLETVSGADLDRRVAELPASGLRRQAATAASGAVNFTRVDTTGALDIPVGTIVGRVDDGDARYRTTALASMAIGVDSVNDVPVVALSPGATGNAPSLAINQIVDGPADLETVRNPSPLTNGQDAESDDALRARARKYLASLARCQPAALEYAAQAFVSTDGQRFSFARIFEDISRPGYSELVVDDGSGLAGVRRAGADATGTVPEAGQTLLWHEAPAVEPIEEVAVDRGGQAITLRRADGDIISIPERGLVYVVDSAALEPDDDWTISGYEVFTGPVAELQKVIEGDLDDPTNLPGRRAAGTRVRVVPPETELVGFDLHVVPVAGADLETMRTAVRDAVIGYLGTLGPGEPAYISKIYARVMADPRVLNVIIYKGGSEPPVAALDVYPSSPRHVLRTDADLVGVVPAPEV